VREETHGVFQWRRVIIERNLSLFGGIFAKNEKKFLKKMATKPKNINLTRLMVFYKCIKETHRSNGID